MFEVGGRNGKTIPLLLMELMGISKLVDVA